MLAGDICGPETNLRTGPRASTRNFTCAPPISMTRLWRARKVPGVLLLARIERILPGIGGFDHRRSCAPPAAARYPAALCLAERKAGSTRNPVRAVPARVAVVRT